MEMMAPLTITHSPHPLLPLAGRTLHTHGWQAGQSVREVLLAHGFDAHQEIVINLNDRLLTVAEWDAVCPQAGDLINVQVEVAGGGGGGGSNPLKIIATIAIAIIAPQIAVGMLGETLAATAIFGSVTYGTVLGAVISFAGNMLVNAIFSPSGNNNLKKASDTGMAASPTYSLAGGSNALRPYEPLPIVMGIHRIFPDYGAKPFTQLSGDDQYLYQIFQFGPSSLQLSDFKIGNTDVADFSGVSFTWPDANGYLAGFSGNVDTTPGGEIKRGYGWVTRTTSVDTVTLAADIEGICYYSGDEGLVNCVAQIEAWYSVAGAESWQPMGTNGVRIYDHYYWSLGEYQTVYSDDVLGGSTVWVQQTYGSTTYADHTPGDVVTISPSPANGWTGGYFTWRWRPYSEILAGSWYSPGVDGGPLTEPAPPQPYTVTNIPTLDIAHGASQKAQRRTLWRSVPKGQYDVRVRLNSATAPDGNNRGATQYSFSQLRSYQEDAASYVNQTRLGMTIQASGQLNGVVEKFSALAAARCAYWTGSAWAWGITSNPAWWYLDFARGRHTAAGALVYGIGLADAQIDIDGIKAWASFCDAQGLGFNAVIDQRQSCADVLTLIARCGLASTSWASGKLGIVWDAPNAAPVMAFGMGNIAKGSFTVAYLTESMADEIVVSYVDASRDWQQQQVRVMTPGTTNPQRTTTVEMMGCTNAAQAGKFANVLAAQQYYRRRTITWETDFEGFVAQRGDVVLLSHDLTQWGYSGRIVSVVGDVVTLDRAVPRSAVDYLMIRQPDGTLTTYTAIGSGGDSDTLTLTSTPTLQAGMLEMDHVWTYSPLPTPGKKVKIISVQPLSVSRVRLVATDEDPAFYAAWNGSWTQAGSNTLLQDLTPQITRIAFNESLVLLNVGNVGSRIVVDFTTDRAFDKISYRWRIGGGSWESVETSSASSIIETTSTGKLEVEARPFFGVRVGRLFSTSTQVMGKTLPPANVSGFSIAAIGGQAHLAWNPANDIDVQINGYLRLRHSSATLAATWSSAIDIGPQVAGTATQTVLPLLAGTYLAKWVDSIGIESVAATGIITTAPDVLGIQNIVATLDQHPAFAGSKTDVGVVDSDLTLESAETIDDQLDLMDTWPRLSALGGIATSGEYLFASGLDLGSVQISRITANLTALAYDMLDTIDERDVVDGWDSVDGDNITDATCTLYLRTTPDDPAGSPAWDAWQPLIVGDYAARAFQFKAVLATASITHNISVSALSATVDMPDRIESGDDIASGAGLYAVNYAKAFMVPPAVGISAQNMATGDYYVIAGKDASGFDITFKNSAGSAVSRTFDYIAKGY